MKQFLYLLILSLAFGFVSCDKDEPTKPDLPPQPPPQPVDTTWFSLKVEIDIVYQHSRWDVSYCKIFFTKEENYGTVFEEYYKEDSHYLEYVEKEWIYEKDEAHKHIGKKRYVYVEIVFGIPGTVQAGSDAEWVEIEIGEGENLIQVELSTPP